MRALMCTLRELRKQLTAGAAVTADKAGKTITIGDATSYTMLRAALRETALTLNVAPFDVPERVAALLTEIQHLRERVAELKAAGVLSAKALIEQGEMLGDVCVVVSETPGANTALMRQLIDQVRKKTDEAAVMLVAVQDAHKLTIVAGLSRGAIDRGGDAGKWVKQTAAIVGGGGGGRPDMAQAGGKSPDKLPAAWMKLDA